MWKRKPLKKRLSKAQQTRREARIFERKHQRNLKERA